MQNYCPYCNKETNLELIKGKEKLKIRGDSIEIDVDFYKCNECKNEYEDQFSGPDTLHDAYNIYRCKHNMVLPKEIKEFRKKYNFTQRELSNILGWGGATLSRYENGALQDKTHDNMLKLIMNPINLIELLSQKPDILRNEKRKKVIEKLYSDRSKSKIVNLSIDYLMDCSLVDIDNQLIGSLINYPKNEFNGFRNFDKNRLFNVIAFFCEKGVFKSMLNKLLFYADFKHYKEHGISLTGSRYAHIPYGPSLHYYDLIFAAAIDTEKIIEPKEIYFNDDTCGEKLISLKKPDLSFFKPYELDTLDYVKNYFKNFNTKKIMEFSHKEVGYQETKNGEIIPYSYAEKLQI